MTDRGTFMPEAYTEWKQEVAWLMEEKGIMPRTPYDIPMAMRVVFTTDSMHFQLYPVLDHTRPKHLKQNDIDNLIGGLMDALQDAGAIADDKQIVEVHAWIQPPSASTETSQDEASTSAASADSQQGTTN